MSNAVIITRKEFETALINCGFSLPNDNIYNHLLKEIREYNFSRQELAMFLAQLIHQSQGFQYKEDKNAVPEDYFDSKDGIVGKSYFGRGFILLTWASNYKAASRDLGLANKLIQDPNIVAQDDALAMKVSVWFWINVVRVEIQANNEDNCFGATTRSINGGIECSGGFHPVAHERWLKYLKVAKALGIENLAKECGCYN